MANQWSYKPDIRPREWLRWAQSFYGMIVHTREHNPGKLLFAESPNETDAIFQYRLDTYEPITLGGITRAKAEMFTAIFGSNFTVPQIDPNIAEYIKEPRFGITDGVSGSGMDFWQYWNKAYAERVVDDANGYFTWLPEGDGRFDANAYLDPEPYMIYSVAIMSLDSDHITFYRPEQFMNVDGEGVIYYFWTITKDAYYRQWYTGNKTKDGAYIYETEPVYVHGLGRLPIIKNPGIYTSSLGVYDYATSNKTRGEAGGWYPGYGMSTGMNSRGMMLPYVVNYQKSFFSGYVPMADEALKTHSTFRSALMMTGSPVRMVQMMDCDECGGTGYRAWDESANGGTGGAAICGSCRGIGKNLIRSNMGEYQFKVQDVDKLPPGAKPITIQDPIKYIHPPVEGLKHLGETAFMYLEKAECELYQMYSDKVRSGDAEETIREGKYKMAAKMSDAMFTAAQEALDILAALRNITNPVPTRIVKPTGFDIPDEDDLMEELKKLGESGAPDSVKLKKQMELAERVFTGDPNARRLVELPSQFDALYNKTADEINSLLSAMPPDEGNDLRRRHIYTQKVLGKLLSEKGDLWLELPIDVQLAEMEEAYQAMIPAVTNANPNPML